jgi:outer membrane lipoprotein carrier protein
VCVLAACAGAAQAGEGRTRLDAFLHGFKSLSGTFEQQQFDETGAPLESSKGTVAIEKPGRFRWEYLQPYAQSIISDGRQLWVYDKDLAQVTVNEVAKTGPGAPARILGDDVDVDTIYTVAEEPTKDGVAWVALTPKAEGSQYTTIEIGLGADGVHGMRLKDNLGQTTVITFHDLVRNGPLEPALFTFTPPAGVDVVHGQR